nr:TPA_asm: hypothetical protein HUJ06_008536 [Nelumbo nucifera]
MSDPLTALMHAVQVMNLLKTLITRALREREENATGAYSPFSSHSSDLQTDDDFNSQQEMDTSCESRGPASDYEDHTHYSQSSADEYEDDPLNEIEECFLRQLDENEKPTNDAPENSVGEHGSEQISPSSCSGFNTESGFSCSDSKNESSGLGTSDGEDSGSSETSMQEAAYKHIPSKVCESNRSGRDMDTVVQRMEFSNGPSSTN